MKKKGIGLGLIGVFFFIIFVSIIPVISSDLLDDFKAQVNRVAYYAQSYEEGNIDYSRLVVYISSVREDIDSILRISGDNVLSEADIVSVLGDAQKTEWVQNTDGTSTVMLENPVSMWKDKIIFDGNEIQLKISILPVMSNKGIVYKSDFSIIFKEKVSEESLKTKINDVKRLAQIYSLEPELQNANRLAKESVNVEKLFISYFSQTEKQCKDIFTNILGEENKKTEETFVVEGYELFNKDGYRVFAILTICEECTSSRDMGLEVLIKKNGQNIGFLIDEISESQFADLGDNGFKAKIIEANTKINTFLEAGEYKSAFTSMKEMEILNNLWNKKMNQGDESEILRSFVDRIQFYDGLFKGYTIVSNFLYSQEEFEKTLFRELENQSIGEICNNNKDDNENNLIDCAENICSGQVCGTEIVNVTDGNETTSKEVELYCIAGICKQVESKPKVTPTSVCGNGLCEIGEGDNCKQDCVTCPSYESLECNGNVIFSGNDENGCPLEPICIAQKTTCSISSECEQPLCGKSECISGECRLTDIDKCDQAKCVDGEKKTVLCNDNKYIVSEICENGVWKSTGLSCIPASEEKIVEQSKVCTIKEDCSQDMVCSNGECIKLVTNIKVGSKTIPKEYVSNGITFTGKVVEITGEYITGTGITGVSRDVNNAEIYGEVDIKNLPKRTYDGEKAESRFTGIVGKLEGEEIELPVEDKGGVTLEVESSSTKELAEGIADEFSVNGICKDSKYEKKASLFFSSSGTKFDNIASLIQLYQLKGSDWCSWELEKISKRRQKLVDSFNDEFARWFFENYLASYADKWETKKQILLDLYSEIIENEKNMAYMMDCLSLKELSSYPLINVNYESDLGTIEVSEELKDIQLKDMERRVKIPNTYMKYSLFLSKDLIKEQLKVDMESYSFPVSSEERKSNGGLTDSEIQKFALDIILKEKLRALTSNYKDGYADVQVLFFSGNGEEREDVYNIYVRANENEILMQPMLPKDVPASLDAKIEVDYDSVYDLMFTSDKNSRDINIKPDWEAGFRITESFGLLVNWIEMQLKINSLMNSISVSPDRDELKDLFKDIFFLIAEK